MLFQNCGCYPGIVDLLFGDTDQLYIKLYILHPATVYKPQVQKIIACEYYVLYYTQGLWDPKENWYNFEISLLSFSSVLSLQNNMYPINVTNYDKTRRMKLPNFESGHDKF